MNVILILLCVFLLSCNGQQQKSNKKDNSNDTNVALVQKDYKRTERTVLGVDSLTITCLMFGVGSDKSFVIKSSNIKSVWINFHNEKERGEFSQEEINHLWYFVKLFYIDKKEKIVLNRTKRACMVSSDYPFIEVIGYKEGKEDFKKSRYIGAEVYDIEFNPKFLEFYEFLDSLVSNK